MNLNSQEIKRIELHGDLSVATAAETYKQFQDALVEEGGLTISFGEVTSIDLTFLQLLSATVQSARQKEVPVALSGDLPEPLLHLAAEAATENLIHVLSN